MLNYLVYSKTKGIPTQNRFLIGNFLQIIMLYSILLFIYFFNLIILCIFFLMFPYAHVYFLPSITWHCFRYGTKTIKTLKNRELANVSKQIVVSTETKLEKDKWEKEFLARGKQQIWFSRSRAESFGNRFFIFLLWPHFFYGTNLVTDGQH